MIFNYYSCTVTPMSNKREIVIRPSPVAYGDHYVLLVIFILFGVFVLHSVAAVIMGVIFLLFTDRLRRSHRYIIDDTHLRIEYHFLSRNEVTIPYHQIQNIRIEQSIVDRSFHTGMVFIDTAGTHSEEIVLNEVYYPEKVRELIEERMRGKKKESLR